MVHHMMVCGLMVFKKGMGYRYGHSQTSCTVVIGTRGRNLETVSKLGTMGPVMKGSGKIIKDLVKELNNLQMEVEGMLVNIKMIVALVAELSIF
mgnify:CR=1 FL=1